MIVADDWRADDIYFMPQLRARIEAKGRRFLSHRADWASCAPPRASMMNGMQYENHNVNTSDPDSYYKYIVQGRRISSSWWDGPWESQLTSARQAGDDPAQSSGSLPNWLAAAGITTGLVGKYQNGYARTPTISGIDYGSLDGAGTALGPSDFPLGPKRVPPDWHYWFAKIGGETCAAGSASNWDGGNQNSYRGWFNEKLEGDFSNIGTNADAIGTPVYHQYDQTVVSGSTTANVVTMRVDGHGLEVGDEVVIEGCTPSAYNVTALVTDVVDANNFKYAIASTPSNISVVGKCYISKYYGTRTMTEKALEFLARRREDEDWFLYYAIDAPHQGSNDNVEVERRYLNTVTTADRFYYGGVAGAVAPTTNMADAQASGAQAQWRQRQETLRTLDDCIAQIDDYLNERGWHDTVIIVTGDQGVHYGEHGIWKHGNNEYFAKATAYDVAAKPALFIRSKKWAPGVVNRQLTMQADLGLTILDFFGLTSHVAHTNRDGQSIQRTFDASNPHPNRAQYLYHQYPNVGSFDAMIDADGWKWIEAVYNGATLVKAEALYNIYDDPDETTNLATTYPARVAAMTARAAVLKAARGAAFRSA